MKCKRINALYCEQNNVRPRTVEQDLERNSSDSFNTPDFDLDFVCIDIEFFLYRE